MPLVSFFFWVDNPFILVGLVVYAQRNRPGDFHIIAAFFLGCL
jgi:hypothetical protein